VAGFGWKTFLRCKAKVWISYRSDWVSPPQRMFCTGWRKFRARFSVRVAFWRRCFDDFFCIFFL